MSSQCACISVRAHVDIHSSINANVGREIKSSKSPVVKGRLDWIPERQEKMVVLSLEGMSESHIQRKVLISRMTKAGFMSDSK